MKLQKFDQRIASLSLFTLFLLSTGCKTEAKIVLPIVSTAEVTNITTQSATSGGTIIDSKGMTVNSDRKSVV